MKLLFKHRRSNNYLGDVVPIVWHTPTYSEMYYILNTRSNASNLRTFGRVQLLDGTWQDGLFLLPDDFVLPAVISMSITISDYTTNSYNLTEFEILEENNVVFFPFSGFRNGISYTLDSSSRYYLGNINASFSPSQFVYRIGVVEAGFSSAIPIRVGRLVRLCKKGSQFSVSATEKIDFAMGNIQYHCLQKIWRFAENQYDIIGAKNANISDSYDGWIDLFGFGTSGVNYSPVLHTTINSDYANGDLLGTPNDWGVNF